MSQSLRLAIRTLLTNKPFTAAAVATLALGIAATTTMLAVTSGVLLKPLPYPEPDRIVKLWERRSGDVIANRETLFTNISYHGWNGKSRTIGRIGSAGAFARTVGLDEPTRLVGSDASPEMFGILGVAPLHGRFFTEEDTREGASPVVVLSERLWRDVGACLPAGRAPEAGRRRSIRVRAARARA